MAACKCRTNSSHVPLTAPQTAFRRRDDAYRPPYRGLEAFREEHAAFFAGRAAFCRALFKFILGKELVLVVGPSGSGKSSVVQAGLVPLLRRQLPPATSWDVITFTPGTDPFLRLASAMMPLLEQDLSETDRLTEAQKLGERLAGGDVRLESVIDRVIDKSNGTGRLLVVADQFEELFTLAPEPKRRVFAGSIVHALGKARFTLLVTLRADFYSQIIALERVGPWFFRKRRWPSRAWPKSSVWTHCCRTEKGNTPAPLLIPSPSALYLSIFGIRSNCR
jgi:hypothetical protein